MQLRKLKRNRFNGNINIVKKLRLFFVKESIYFNVRIPKTLSTAQSLFNFDIQSMECRMIFSLVTLEHKYNNNNTKIIILHTTFL